MNNKKLYKSNERKLFGVCGGIAEYLGIDPAFVRIAWVLLALAWGASIPLYVICAVLMKSRPDYDGRCGGQPGEMYNASTGSEDTSSSTNTSSTSNIEKKDYIDAVPSGYTTVNGEKQELYR